MDLSMLGNFRLVMIFDLIGWFRNYFHKQIESSLHF